MIDLDIYQNFEVNLNLFLSYVLYYLKPDPDVIKQGRNVHSSENITKETKKRQTDRQETLIRRIKCRQDTESMPKKTQTSPKWHKTCLT